MGKVIVIGGSAGAVESLCALLEGLPPDIPAPVLAVIHIPERDNQLPQVFQRCNSMLRTRAPLFSFRRFGPLIIYTAIP